MAEIDLDLSGFGPPPAGGGSAAPAPQAPSTAGAVVPPAGAAPPGQEIDLDLTAFGPPPPPIAAGAFAGRYDPRNSSPGPIPSPAAAMAEPSPEGPNALQMAMQAIERRGKQGSLSIGTPLGRDVQLSDFQAQTRNRIGSAVEGITGGRDEIAGILGGMGSALSGGDWSEGYNAAYAGSKQRADLWALQHPVQDIASQVVGVGATLPLLSAKVVEAAPGAGALARGGARVLNAIPGNAALSAVHAAGSAEPGSDRVDAFGRGAVEGALVGVGGEAAGALVGGTWNALRKMQNPIGELIRTAGGMLNPSAAASRMIGQELKTAPGGAPAIVKRMEGAQAEGVPLSVGAAGGETTGRLARATANASPEAGAALKETIDPLHAGQATRMEDALKAKLTYSADSTPEMVETLHARARDSLEPAYEAVRNSHPEGIATPRLRTLIETPEMHPFLAKAESAAKLDALAGRGAGPYARSTNSMFKTGNPTVDFWDQLQREIRGASDAAYRGGNAARGATLAELRRQLLTEVDRAVPEFPIARGIARQFKGAENALDVGRMAVTDAKIGEPEIMRALRDATDDERKLMREGYLHGKIQQVIGGRENRSLADAGQFWRGERERRVARALLGPRDYAAVEVMRDAESGLNSFHRAVNANSSTAQQLWKRLGVGAAQGLAFGWLSGSDSGSLSSHAGHAALGIVFRLGGMAIPFRGAAEERVFRQVVKQLLSNDPRVAEAAARRVAGNPRLSQVMRGFALGADRLLHHVQGNEGGG